MKPPETCGFWIAYADGKDALNGQMDARLLEPCVPEMGCLRKCIDKARDIRVAFERAGSVTFATRE